MRKRSIRKSYRQSRRGKFARKTRTRRFQSRVKKALMKTTETKYLMAASEAQSCYHDRGAVGAGAGTSNQGAHIWNPWYYITKGTNISNRIGDEVYPRGMSLRFAYWTEADRPSQFLRVIVAVIPKIVNTSITDGSNFDLLDSAGSNDTVSGMIKKEGVKVLYDRIFTFTNPDKNGATTRPLGNNRLFKKLFIKRKRSAKLSWGQDGLLQNKPVGVWFLPYDNYYTLRTDNIGQLSYTYKLYFKDV